MAPRLVESAVKRTGKTPPLRRGFPPVFFVSGRWQGGADSQTAQNRAPNQAIPHRQGSLLHSKACAWCSGRVKPSRRNTKARLNLGEHTGLGTAARGVTSAALCDRSHAPQLSRPLVRGVNYLHRRPSWSPPKPLTADEKANLWRLEQARQLLRWWVIEYRHGFLYA